MEIVGFWTPEYLAHKRNTLQQFRHHRILIAIPEKSRRKVSLTGLREGANVDEKVLLYKTVIKLKPLMEDMERIRHSSTCFIRHKVR
jgi:predicted nuclease of restriction endonuclease-like RecB superfamily